MKSEIFVLSAHDCKEGEICISSKHCLNKFGSSVLLKIYSNQLTDWEKMTIEQQEKRFNPPID